MQDQLRILLFDAVDPIQGRTGVHIAEPGSPVGGQVDPIGELAVDGQLDLRSVFGVESPDPVRGLDDLLQQCQGGLAVQLMDQPVAEPFDWKPLLGDVQHHRVARNRYDGGFRRRQHQAGPGEVAAVVVVHVLVFFRVGPIDEKGHTLEHGPGIPADLKNGRDLAVADDGGRYERAFHPPGVESCLETLEQLQVHDHGPPCRPDHHRPRSVLAAASPRSTRSSISTASAWSMISGGNSWPTRVSLLA